MCVCNALYNLSTESEIGNFNSVGLEIVSICTWHDTQFSSISHAIAINMATNAIAVRLKSDNYYKELFKNFKLDDFIDVILWAEGRSVPAHRCILAAASSVFHDMLKVCNNHGQMPMRK